VVVPGSPGPLVRFDPVSGRTGRRGRDDLDALIDEVLPEIDERAGWFDAALVVAGVALLLWALLGDRPGFVVVLGVVALGVGGILPVRAGWRRAGQARARRRRQGRLARGVALDVSLPSARRLVRAYESLLDAESSDGADASEGAVVAAHGALLEAASLLQGRAPASDREHEYVERRADAIEALAATLGEIRGGRGARPPAIDPAALVEARDEVDRISGFNSVTRLEELAEEVRRRGPA